MIKAILFDLDGTLLGLDNDRFGKPYIYNLYKGVFESMGFDPKSTYKTVFGAIGIMAKNPDFNKTNLDQFYSILKEMIKPYSIEEAIEKINYFYTTPLYDELVNVVDKRLEMIEAIKILKEKGYRLGICTNPMFPRLAIEKRIMWAGIDINDFEFVTYCEETHSLKPNLTYYEEVIDRFLPELDKSEIMMVGNDVEEDMIVSKLGLQTYLVKDYMISRFNKENEILNQGTGKDFLNYVKEKL